MIYTAEQFIASNQASVHAYKNLSIHAFAGFEKLVALNLSTTKSLLANALSHVQSALGAKDAYELMALRADLLESWLEKTNAYGQHAHALATGTGLELSKVSAAQLKEVKTAFVDALQNLAQNAPPGVESAIHAFNSAVKTTQTLIESAQSAAKTTA